MVIAFSDTDNSSALKDIAQETIQPTILTSSLHQTCLHHKTPLYCKCRHRLAEVLTPSPSEEAWIRKNTATRVSIRYLQALPPHLIRPCHGSQASISCAVLVVNVRLVSALLDPRHRVVSFDSVSIHTIALAAPIMWAFTDECIEAMWAGQPTNPTKDRYETRCWRGPSIN